MFFFSKLNITQRALCSPGIKKSYMKECLLHRYWSALDKNSRQWSYKPIPPIAHAASHKIIMWVLTMRISTLTPWKVVRNFCGSKSVPSVEGEWKLSQSPQTILGQSNFVPYECSSGCVSHWSLQPVFFCFDALLATPHISEGFRPETGIYYVAQPSRRTHHQFALRGHMTSICHNETVSRQNLWADLWRQWVTILLVYSYPSW